jgi:hypothetical protein
MGAACAVTWVTGEAVGLSIDMPPGAERARCLAAFRFWLVR